MITLKQREKSYAILRKAKEELYEIGNEMKKRKLSNVNEKLPVSPFAFTKEEADEWSERSRQEIQRENNSVCVEPDGFEKPSTGIVNIIIEGRLMCMFPAKELWKYFNIYESEYDINIYWSDKRKTMVLVEKNIPKTDLF